MAQRFIVRLPVAPHHFVSGLIAATLAAVIVAGCGTASNPAQSASGRVPGGFVLNRGDGFSVAVPSGFRPAAAGLSGLPAGATVKMLTPGGASPGHTGAQIFTAVNPNLQFDIDQVATNLREADSTDRQLSDVHTSVRAVTVPGAQEAREVTETYVAHYVSSEPAKGPIHRSWLMVLPKPGTLIDIVVSVEPALGGKLDPSTVFNSFRLDR